MTPNPAVDQTFSKKAKIENVATLASMHYLSNYLGASTYSIVQNYEHFSYFEINATVPNQLDFWGDLFTAIPNLPSTRVLA